MPRHRTDTVGWVDRNASFVCLFIYFVCVKSSIEISRVAHDTVAPKLVSNSEKKKSLECDLKCVESQCSPNMSFRRNDCVVGQLNWMKHTHTFRVFALISLFHVASCYLSPGRSSEWTSCTDPIQWPKAAAPTDVSAQNLLTRNSFGDLNIAFLCPHRASHLWYLKPDLFDMSFSPGLVCVVS